MSVHSPAEPRRGSRVFQAIFALTAPLALAMLLGFVLEPVLETELPDVLGVSANVIFLGLVALLYLIEGVLLGPAWGPGRTWLRLSDHVPVGQALLSTALWAPAGYAVALPFCLAIALALTGGNARGEAGVFVALFTLWMPLWWAVPIGAVLAWRRARRAGRPAPRSPI
jgi:hypothetical protein